MMILSFNLPRAWKERERKRERSKENMKDICDDWCDEKNNECK